MENPSANTVGFEPVRTTVGTFPEHGTWFLRGIPPRTLEPAQFIIGSRSQLERFFSKFKDEFDQSQPLAVQEWANFLRRCPLTDDSAHYASMMHIPFKSVLFSVDGEPCQQVNIHAAVHSELPCFAGNPIRSFRSTASVQHHNRGQTIPVRPPPRIEVGAQSVSVTVHHAPAVDIVRARRMKIPELKNALLVKGLSTRGKKAELLERLIQSI